MNNQPWSTVHGSVETQLIVHASHHHALIKDDNALVYYYIEEAWNRGLPVVKCKEAFNDFLNRVIGSRYIPLAYVVPSDPIVPNQDPPLMNNQPWSTVHGSVEAQSIVHASHDRALIKDDNALFYYYIEEAWNRGLPVVKWKEAFNDFLNRVIGSRYIPLA
jgi:antitoxin component of RelBE/YafQ-DinJ toxin-antitoxin module